MKILYGTTNRGKIEHMREMLHGMDVEIIGLEEVSKDIPKVVEDGSTPLENARKKAERYFRGFKVPVFACDSGLYLEGLKVEEQPGVNVRRVGGRELSDEEMIEHYSKIARENGGEVVGWYENAISFIVNDDIVFEYQGMDISSEKFIILEKPCNKRVKGFPIDSLSKEIKSGEYYLEGKGKSENKNAMAEGFREFFNKSLDSLNKVGSREERLVKEEVMENIILRRMMPGEEGEVSTLIEEVFTEFIAPEYSPEGIGEFKKYIQEDSLTARREDGNIFIVAVDGDEIIGVVEMRDMIHISLFFIDKNYHGRGIGRMLTEEAIGECRRIEPGIKTFTVNSSPYAEEIYERLGFKRSREEQVVKGIRFIPMEMVLER